MLMLGSANRVLTTTIDARLSVIGSNHNVTLIHPRSPGLHRASPTKRSSIMFVNTGDCRLRSKAASSVRPGLRMLGVALMGMSGVVPAAQGEPTRKVLIVAIDGLRPDALLVANAPNLHAWIEQGAYSLDAQCEDITISGPNWSSILHGVHRDKHRVTNNNYSENRLRRYPDLFARIEAQSPARNTYRVLTWREAERNQPTGADFAIYRSYERDGDEKATADIAALLSGTHPDYEADPDVLFVFYSDVDVAGHSYGFHPSKRRYVEEIEDVDRQIGIIMDAMRARSTYPTEEWLIVLTSDHGGAADGSHGGGTPEKRTIPFVVSGPSAMPGPVFPQARNVDVTRTVLAFLGIADDAVLDGHVVGLSASGPPQAGYERNLIFNGDGEFDRGFPSDDFDQHVSGWIDPGPAQMTLVAYDSRHGWPDSGDPGPPDRGHNFVTGGQSEVSEIVQAVDLFSISGDIDAGSVTFELSAWLGGYKTQQDDARVHIEFLDGDGNALTSSTIGPVTPADRRGKTGLHLRASQGEVPVGARVARVAIRADRVEGTSNDGYTDNVALILHR